jgi:hypothetical protein
LLALGAALEWAALAQYVRHHGSLSLFERAFAAALPSVGRNLLATIPVFAAFVVAGTMLFGDQTERFSTLPWSSIALFAVANGDVVRETMQVTMQYQAGAALRLLAQAVMYAYACTFIYVILKTTPAIVEEAFLATRPAPRGAKGSTSPAPEGYTLPPHIRTLLLAMQDVQDAGGSVSLVVRAMCATVPLHVRVGYTAAVEGGGGGSSGEGGDDAAGGGDSGNVGGAGGGGDDDDDVDDAPPPVRPNSFLSDSMRWAAWVARRGAMFTLGITRDADADVVGPPPSPRSTR